MRGRIWLTAAFSSAMGFMASMLVAKALGRDPIFGVTTMVGLGLACCFALVDVYPRREMLIRAGVLYVVVVFFAMVAIGIVWSGYAVYSVVAIVAVMTLSAWVFKSLRFGMTLSHGMTNGFVVALMTTNPHIPMTLTAMTLVCCGAAFISVVALSRFIVIKTPRHKLMRSQFSLYALRCQFGQRAWIYLNNPGRKKLRRLFQTSRAFHHLSMLIDGIMAQGNEFNLRHAEAFHRSVFDLDLSIRGMFSAIKRLGKVVEQSGGIEALASKEARLLRNLLGVIKVFSTVSRRDHILVLEAIAGLKDELAEATKARINGEILTHVSRIVQLIEDFLDAAQRSVEQGDELVDTGEGIDRLLGIGGIVPAREAWTRGKGGKTPSRFATAVKYMGTLAPTRDMLVADVAATKRLWAGLHLSANSQATLQTFVAMTVATTIGYLFEPSYAFWSSIGAFVILRGTAGGADRIRKASERMIGTLLGAGISMLAVQVLGVKSVWVSLVIVCVSLGVVATTKTESHRVFVMGLTVALAQVWYLSAPTMLPEQLVTRVVETLVGAIAGVGVAAFFLPIRTRETLWVGLSTMLYAVVHVLEEITLSLRLKHARPRIYAREVNAAVNQIEDLLDTQITVARLDRDEIFSNSLRRKIETIEYRTAHVAVAASRVSSAFPDEAMATEVYEAIHAMTVQLKGLASSLRRMEKTPPRWKRGSEQFETLSRAVPEDHEVKKGLLRELSRLDDAIAVLRRDL